MITAIISYIIEQLPYTLVSDKHFIQSILLNPANNTRGRYLTTNYHGGNTFLENGNHILGSVNSPRKWEMFRNRDESKGLQTTAT